MSLFALVLSACLEVPRLPPAGTILPLWRRFSLNRLSWRFWRAGLIQGILAACCSAPPAARCAFGGASEGLPGRWVALGAGTLQLGLGVLGVGTLQLGLGVLGAGTLQLGLGVLGVGLKGGAGVLGRRDLGFECRSQLGLFPRGVLADLGHLPVRGVASPVQLRLGCPGGLARLGRLLLCSPGERLGFVGPAPRAGYRAVPLQLRRVHLFLSFPTGLGDPCPRGFLGGHGRLLGGHGRLLGGDCRLLGDGGRSERRRQPRIGLSRRAARLLGVSLGLPGAGLKGGAGVLGRRDLGFECRSQLGLFPRGVLADLGHLPVRGVAGPVQLRLGCPGGLARLGRLLLCSPGERLGFVGPAPRAGYRAVPLQLRRVYLFLSCPSGLGDPCPRGFLGGHGRLLGGGGRSERRRQPRIGLSRRAARLLGVSLVLLAALPGSAAMSARMPQRSP